MSRIYGLLIQRNHVTGPASPRRSPPASEAPRRATLGFRASSSCRVSGLVGSLCELDCPSYLGRVVKGAEEWPPYYRPVQPERALRFARSWKALRARVVCNSSSATASRLPVPDLLFLNWQRHPKNRYVRVELDNAAIFRLPLQIGWSGLHSLFIGPRGKSSRSRKQFGFSLIPRSTSKTAFQSPAAPALPDLLPWTD